MYALVLCVRVEYIFSEKERVRERVRVYILCEIVFVFFYFISFGFFVHSFYSFFLLLLLYILFQTTEPILDGETCKQTLTHNGNMCVNLKAVCAKPYFHA